MVLYDKPLQARLSGKRHMEPIWAAAGRTKGVSVTRHEARLRPLELALVDWVEEDGQLRAALHA